MYYFKKIIFYFDYYESGEKKKNCGYGKMIVKDEEVTIEIQVKGLDIRESRTCDIYTSGIHTVSLGKITLEKGTGCFRACLRGTDINGSGVSVFAVTGLLIRIDEKRQCETAWEWGDVPEAKAARAGQDMAAETVHEEAAERETVREEASSGEAADHMDEESASSHWGEADALEEKEPDVAGGNITDRPGIEDVFAQKEARQPAGGDPAKEEADGTGMSLHKTQLCGSFVNRQPGRETETAALEETLYEDKWQQLCSIYPVCHPFDDGEDYISIAPKDFVILRKEYQNLVSNSFLLHSFYNYHHVILGKTGVDDMYYIGAPGAYLEREKKVAVMFGFEGFAQSARGNDSRVTNRRGRPVVETGAFGYYMRKVEI